MTDAVAAGQSRSREVGHQHQDVSGGWLLIGVGVS